MYTKEEQIKIQRVAAAFETYLQQSRNIYGYPKCDLQWLDNLQYYLLVLNYNDTAELVENNMLVIPIDSADTLYRELIEEITHETYERQGLLDVPQQERSQAQIQQLQQTILLSLAPYMEVLPEYKDLAEQTVIQYGQYYMDDSLVPAEYTLE